MRMGSRTAFAAVALAILAVPAATAQVQTDLRNPTGSTPTTLYFHIFDTFNAFPINTQAMNVSFFEVGGTSFPTVSGTPVSGQAGDYDFNSIYGFSTSGPVEYDFIENGRPRFHPERGIAADVDIDPNVQPYVYLYLDVRDLFSADSLGGIGPIGGLPNLLPSFTVRVTMREGNVIGSDLDAGDLIMVGEMTAHIAETHTTEGNSAIPPGQADPNGNQVLVPDSSGVVEYKIPMDLSVGSNTIPKADSFNVRIDWFQNPTGDPQFDDKVAEGWVRLVSNAEHLPRLEMNVLNPVYISFIHPQVAAGILLIHMGVNSPWGTYDVDVANITVDIQGPDQPEDLELVVTQNAHVHGLHDKDAEITYLWRFREERSANGEYAINVAVNNMAKSATATGTAGFILEGQRAYGIDTGGQVVEPSGDQGGGKGSPGAPAFAAALALLGAALLLRRRQA